jgi:hypothetical protein
MPQNHKDTRKKSLFFSGRSSSAPEEYFLPKDTFAEETFQNQLTNNILEPQALPLKKALDDILIKIKSEENLEFIEKIHAINSNKQNSPLVIHNKLEEIEEKYIAAGAPTRLNIEPTVLNKILKDAKSNRRLHDYAKAVKDIFELIRNNVDSYVHIKPERKKSLELIDAAVFFAQSLNTINNIETIRLGILKSFRSSNRDTVLFAECQKVCRNAQQKTFALLGEQGTEVTSDFKNKLTKILFDVKQALESRIGAIQQTELRHNFGAIKTNTVNNIIVSIDRVITRLNLKDLQVKKHRSGQVAPLNEDTTKSNRPK